MVPRMKIFYFITLFFLSTISYADCIGNNCTNVTIDRIYLYPNGSNLRIGTSGDESKLDCIANGGSYISLDLSQTYAKEAYSLLLGAHHSQSTFWIQTTGENTDCGVVYLVSDK